MEFPSDFVNASSNLEGNYTIILVSKNINHVLASIPFYVVTNSVLSSFSNFMFGKGLAITFGLVGAVITIIYQILSQFNQDRGRRIENKANWMIQNMKYHNFLLLDSVAIYNQFKGSFEGKDDNQRLDCMLQDFNPEKILMYTIRFCKDYGDFENNAGTFYFDDYIPEQFMVNLKDELLKLISDMINDEYTELERFFHTERIGDLRKDEFFKMYRELTRLWVSDIANARKLFLNYFVFSNILFVKVNKVVLVNYTSSSKNVRAISKIMESQYMDILKRHIDTLNNKFYKNKKQLYYHLYKSRLKLWSRLDI